MEFCVMQDKPMPGSSVPPRSGSLEEALARFGRYRDEKAQERALAHARKVEDGKIRFPYKD